MAKDKSTKKVAAVKVAAAKPVKEGRVTKPAETPKAKSKEVAKKAAKVTEKDSKKSKKSKKEPTPEPESDSDEEMDSDSSASGSDSESEKEVVKPAAKKVAAKEETSDSDSDSDSESEAEGGAKVNGAAKVAAAATSSDSSDSESDSEEEKPAPKAGAAKEATSDSSDSDSDSDSEEEAKPAKVEEPSKKRKAETEAAAPAGGAKKVKHEGEFSPASNVLFVGGLSWNVDEDWLSREFEDVSPISVRVITHADTGRSKGFAYVEFADTDAAIEALNAKHGAEVDGRALRCDFSSPRQPKAEGDRPARTNQRAEQFGDKKSVPSATLFCGNLSFDTTQDSLTGYFSEYGSINGIRIPTDRDTGAPKGYGYIEFSSVEEAQGALDAMNGADVDGRNIRLDYSTPRDPSAPRGGGGFGGRGGGDRGGRGGFSRGGGRGGRGGFGDRGGRGGGRGGSRGGFGDRGGRGGSTNRSGVGEFAGKKTSFD